MEQITVAQLLEQYGLTSYQLHKRGAGSKSMCNDWKLGRHLPSTKSVARIVRALGLPLPYVRAILKSRNQWENSPRVPWGTHVRQAMMEDITTGRIESGGPICPTCGRPHLKSA
jgi:hypothetical protein